MSLSAGVPVPPRQPDPTVDLDLARAVAETYADPLRFVLTMFPWGEGPLAAHAGPRAWQWDFLVDLGAAVAARGFDGREPVAPVLMSTASGHGIGKSALTAWCILWLMSTRPGARGIVTANTGDQLRTKTWAELGKWWKRCLTRGWFSFSQSKGAMSLVRRGQAETWRCDALTSREEQSEAFAGQHAADSTSFYIFDEASAVPDAIWDVAMGGLTDGEPVFLAFGNPTRNSGRFHETHHRLRHRWATRQIDSRDVAGTNKALFAQWVADYGDDSDFVRVRVRGQFPRRGVLQFIDADVARAAQTIEPVPLLSDPVVVGVDVARFGDDQSVIVVRRGKDARTEPWQTFRGVDTMTLAGRVGETIDKVQADAVFVDDGGVGGGVVDRLRQLGRRVTAVNFGGLADRGTLNAVDAAGERYANKRAEMWGAMRAWLKGGGAVPDDPALQADLTGVEYGFDAQDRIQLERKELMKRRGLASPDLADALALTFAYPVAPRTQGQDGKWRGRGGPTVRSDYVAYQ